MSVCEQVASAQAGNARLPLSRIYTSGVNSLLSIAALTVYPHVNCGDFKPKLLLYSITPVFTIGVLVFHFNFLVLFQGQT